MKRMLLTALALVAVAAGALGLTAFRGHRDPAHAERFITNRVDDLLDDVHATPAQRQQIVALRDKLLADMKGLHGDHGSLHRELVAQWKSDQPDAARVHAAVDQRVDAMKGFADELADAVLQVHGILTPDQRAILTKKLQRHLDE